MNINQSPSGDNNIKSLLIQSPTEQQSGCLLQDEILSDLPIVDEVTISTAEASLSAVISSSLQVVSRDTLEDEQDDDDADDSEVHETSDDVCDAAVDESHAGPSPKPSVSSDEELGEDDLVNLARSTDSETGKWQSVLHRKRPCIEVSTYSIDSCTHACFVILCVYTSLHDSLFLA